MRENPAGSHRPSVPLCANSLWTTQEQKLDDLAELSEEGRFGTERKGRRADYGVTKTG